jgi:hypothetical protein
MSNAVATTKKMTMSEYLSLNALSSGVCHKILSESPLHARLASPWNDSLDRDNSKTADIGSAAHACLLEGSENGIQIIDADDWRTKVAKELRDAAYSDGKIPMLAGKMRGVRAMVDAAREYLANSEIAGVFDTGEPEVTLLFELAEIPCKARCDWLTADRRICLSYKTTQGSANPDSWIRTQLPQYDLATVFYEAGVRAACKVEGTSCIHLVQEQNYPYSCSLISLDPAYKAMAESKLDRALAIWSDCTATSKWPAYPSRICYAEPKAWQQAEAEEKQGDDSAFFKGDELKDGIPL